MVLLCFNLPRISNRSWVFRFMLSCCSFVLAFISSPATVPRRINRRTWHRKTEKKPRRNRKDNSALDGDTAYGVNCVAITSHIGTRKRRRTWRTTERHRETEGHQCINCVAITSHIGTRKRRRTWRTTHFNCCLPVATFENGRRPRFHRRRRRRRRFWPLWWRRCLLCLGSRSSSSSSCSSLFWPHVCLCSVARICNGGSTLSKMLWQTIRGCNVQNETPHPPSPPPSPAQTAHGWSTTRLRSDPCCNCLGRHECTTPVKTSKHNEK